MENNVNKHIDVLTTNFAKSYDDLVEKNISKAGYDKTLIGFVSEKIEREDGSYFTIGEKTIGVKWND